MRAFQRRHGLTVDGVVGKTTWDAIYREYRSIQSDNGTPNAYPGTPLRPGDRGQNVRLVQFWLKIARSVYSALNDVGVDGIFGPSTTAAVKKFQSYFGLASDGIVGRATWSKLYEVYNDAANDLLAPNLRPGDYPGVLRVGSSGRAVRELQFYLVYPQRLPEQYSGGEHRRSVWPQYRSIGAGVPEVCRADGGRHRGPCYLGFAVQAGLSAAPVRACDHV